MLERIQSGAGYVITYWELGLDMGGAPEAARRAFWRDLLARLAMPKGTLAFWPLNILDAESGALLPSPGHFQAGAERLGAETVLCFGRRCADVLGLPPDLDPYASCQSAGRACLLLPELNDLLGGGDPLETLVHALSRLVRR